MRKRSCTLSFICVIIFLIPVHVFSKTNVTILADDGYPPYSYLDQNTKKAAGFYVDIINEASKIIPEYNINVEDVPWKRGLKSLEDGNAFALIPPYLKKDRKYIEPYSVPIYTEIVVLKCLPEYFKNLKGHNFPEDFKGAIVLVNAGYLLSDNLVDAFKKKILIKEEARSTEFALKKLARKRADCFANDKLSIESTLHKMKIDPLEDKQIIKLELKNSTVLAKENAYIGYTARPSKGLFGFKNNFIYKMNIALETMKKNGKIQDIFDKYTGYTAKKLR